MRYFREGDYVLCVDDKESANEIQEGKLYRVKEVLIYALKLHGVDTNFFNHRFKKIEDNAVNRLLYPEAFSEV